jgi:hypothetical protein
MNKTQLKTLATKIHGLTVKSANGKKPVQNKAIEKIAVLLNQAMDWRRSSSPRPRGERQQERR